MSALWLIDVARAIREVLGPAARRVPAGELPDWLVRLSALFDAATRPYVPDLGREMRIDDSLTRRTLGMSYIPRAGGRGGDGEEPG